MDTIKALKWFIWIATFYVFALCILSVYRGIELGPLDSKIVKLFYAIPPRLWLVAFACITVFGSFMVYRQWRKDNH